MSELAQIMRDKNITVTTVAAPTGSHHSRCSCGWVSRDHLSGFLATAEWGDHVLKAHAPPPPPPPLKDLIELPPELRVVAVINHAFGGVHHVRNLRKHTESKYPYWSCSFYAPVCNWDFDNLSRLVVASLEYGVRIELAGGGPNKMKLQLFPRYTREGAIHDRIPRLEHFVKGFDYNTRLAEPLHSAPSSFSS